MTQKKNQPTNFFALDIGNKQSKLKNSKDSYVFPSSLINQRDVASVFSTSKPDGVIDLSLNGDTQKYYWGAGILNYSQDKIQDSLGFEGRYQRNIYRLLNEFALAFLAKDYIESELTAVSVIAGVPTGDYNKETVDEIKSIFLEKDGQDFKPRRHLVTVDGKEIIVRVVQVLVVPQPIGTFYDVVLNDELKPNSNNVALNRVGIIDVGGGTLLLDQIINANLDRQARLQLPTGTDTLYNSVKSLIELELGISPDVHKIEAMVRDGLERGFDNAKFVYKQSANNIFDITELVLGEIDHYTSNVIDKVYGAFKNIAEIDTLLVTGGTSNILNHDMFEKAFAKQAAVVFVDNAEYANVNGFLKYDKYLNSNM